LAHRLLAEYRQALLQQHSLHTNSVSTPNLTASQELQMFSSSTAAEEIEEVEVDLGQTERPKSKRTKHSKSHGQRNQHADSHSKESHSRPDSSGQTARPDPTDLEQNASDPQAPRRRRRRRKEPNSIDSPDYVNAAAFRGERCGAGERPLSLASSTDMESNGTFRVLSSLDTRTSSVACGSFGNLTAPGTSFGSGDGNGFDLIQGIHNSTGSATPNPPAVGVSDLRAPDTGPDSSPRQSVNLSWDQLSQRRRRCLTNRSANRGDLDGSQDPVGTPNALFAPTGWIKSGEPPPDLCLSSTYPNLCEEQHTTRDPGHLMTRQAGTVSDLSPRQRDSSFRRHVVGEYENLDSLSNDKLNRLRSTRQPVLPVRQSKVQSETTQKILGTSSEANQNGSLSTLGYSTTTSMPASPSSESVSSMSSTVSTSSKSSSTSSSSSELGCTAVISDPIRDLEDRGDVHCETIGHSPTPFSMSKEDMETGNTSTTDGTDVGSQNVIGNVGAICEFGCGRQKACSVDPCTRSTRPALKFRQQTPVGFRSTQMATSRSTQNCRRPTGQLPKLWRGTNSMHNKRLKSCLKSLPWSAEHSAGVSCLSYSDEDATEVLCYLSDDERHRADDATSATLSAAESPCFSSASSYSFSTSSLDAQTEELCPYYHHHHHHWFAPSCTPLSCMFHEPERARRGGSLDPSTSIQRLPNVIRSKRASQPSSYHSSHRKRSSELHSLQSNQSVCPCVHQHPCVCYTFDAHRHVHGMKPSGNTELHHSLEEGRQNRLNRRIKSRQSAPTDSIQPGIPVRPPKPGGTLTEANIVAGTGMRTTINGTTTNMTNTTNTAQCASTEVSLQLLRPKDLQLAPRANNQTNRASCSLQSVGCFQRSGRVDFSICSPLS
uniref:Pecanex-like protein n=1 Tax=Echinostoma caproni TaxID=27848 RepID=A0A183A092_9TREM